MEGDLGDEEVLLGEAARVAVVHAKEGAEETEIAAGGVGLATEPDVGGAGHLHGAPGAVAVAAAEAAEASATVLAATAAVLRDCGKKRVRYTGSKIMKKQPAYRRSG